MKRVFITGVEGPGSGKWEWFQTKEAASADHEMNLTEFSTLPGEIIYRGELDVPEGTDGMITDFIESFLDEHGFELSPLLNKEIIGLNG